MVEIVERKELAATLVHQSIERILMIGEKSTVEYWTRYRDRDISTYSDYLLRKAVNANSVRNFIYDTKSASLYNIYVPTTIKAGFATGERLLQKLSEPANDTKKRPAPAMVIVGNAGTGKSLFMKHAFFFCQSLEEKRIPLLIELRSFNRLTAADFQTRIYDDVVATGTTIAREQLGHGLRSGLFTILLDGMDELKGEIQKYYEAELQIFAKKFPLCPVLVSSRPTEDIKSWNLFDVHAIAPLDVAAAEDLIKRLEFDETVKIAFIALLKALFESHYDFVSVPLLCTIMLITFSDSGHITEHPHEFFEDAFNALWSKHDGRKEGFERHRYTGLQKNEFSRLLAAFSVSSYRNADYDMRESQFERHFSAAVSLSSIKCKQEDFLKDLTISTSLAIQDGPFIRFCHRSFQEYFSALFLCTLSDDKVGELIEELSDRIETDIVLPLVLLISDEKIEKLWVLPHVEKISKFSTNEGSDIAQYANEAGSDGVSVNRLSDTMKKIRILYELSPSSDELRSVYYASRDMRLSISQMMKNDSSSQMIFERDRKNFLQLRERLAKKYERRASALHDLLKQ